jgi:hypothetical protein
VPDVPETVAGTEEVVGRAEKCLEGEWELKGCEWDIN